MARKKSPTKMLSDAFDQCDTPVYLVDSARKIVYCNAALAAWTNTKPEELIGKLVEYHSEMASGKVSGVAAGLCPMPSAFSGTSCQGHVSCQEKSGHLVYRAARFEVLKTSNETTTRTKRTGAKTTSTQEGFQILCLLAGEDQSSEDAAAWATPRASSDALHMAIRAFRRNQVKEFSLASILGTSPAMQTVRRQASLAVRSSVPVAIVGRPGSGREHLAKTIHYSAYNAEIDPKFALLDADQLAMEEFEWMLNSMKSAKRTEHPSSILVKQFELAKEELQSAFLTATSTRGLRFMATMERPPRILMQEGVLHPHLAAALEALVIEIPPLATRTEDIPILAQYFLEAKNPGRAMQLEGFAQESLERLASYTWPGEVEEFREVIQTACETAKGPQIEPNDLPNLVHHASAAAALPTRPVEMIDLESILETMERDAILAALETVKGNKTKAAELVGMNRPRFYRRLEQLGLGGEGDRNEDETS